MNPAALVVTPMLAAGLPVASSLVPPMQMHEGRGQAHPAAAASAGRLGEEFARALEEQGADEDTVLHREPEAPAGLQPWPPAPPAPSTGMAPAPAPVAAPCHAPTDAIAAATKLQDMAPAAPTAITQVDAGQVWELSLYEPDGLALSLRAERVSAPASPPPPLAQRRAARAARRLNPRRVRRNTAPTRPCARRAAGPQYPSAPMRPPASPDRKDPKGRSPQRNTKHGVTQ